MLRTVSVPDMGEDPSLAPHCAAYSPLREDGTQARSRRGGPSGPSAGSAARALPYRNGSSGFWGTGGQGLQKKELQIGRTKPLCC